MVSGRDIVPSQCNLLALIEHVQDKIFLKTRKLLYLVTKPNQTSNKVLVVHHTGLPEITIHKILDMSVVFSNICDIPGIVCFGN